MEVHTVGSKSDVAEVESVQVQEICGEPPLTFNRSHDTKSITLSYFKSVMQERYAN